MNLLQSENSISVIQSGTIIDKLPVANYLLKYNSDIQHYWLERIEDFHPPKKMYGARIHALYARKLLVGGNNGTDK